MADIKIMISTSDIQYSAVELEVNLSEWNETINGDCLVIFLLNVRTSNGLNRLRVQVRPRPSVNMTCLLTPGKKRPDDSSCRHRRPDSASHVGSRPSFFPLKTLLPCQTGVSDRGLWCGRRPRGPSERQSGGGRGGGEGTMARPSYRIRADHTLNGHIDAAA